LVAKAKKMLLLGKKKKKRGEMDTETGTCCSAVTDTNILGSE